MAEEGYKAHNPFSEFLSQNPIAKTLQTVKTGKPGSFTQAENFFLSIFILKLCKSL